MPLPALSSLRRHTPAVATAVVGCAVYMVWQPVNNDLSNQYLRAWVFGRDPLSPVNNQWFGGHHTYGYSVLAQPLGWLVGPMLLGVVATLGIAAAASVLCHLVAESDPRLRHPDLAAAMATVGCMTSLYGGRTAFLLGAAFAFWALVAAVAGRAWPAGLLAIGGALSSPVVALFLALVGGAMWLGRSARLKVAAAVAVPPVVVVGSLSYLFPDKGDFPLLPGGLLATVAVTALVAAAGWRHATVRWACIANAALCLLVWVVPTPIGGNAVRLAAIAAPAVLVMCPLVTRWVSLAAIGLVAVTLWVAPLTLAVTGDTEQAHAEFYAPLIEVLAARPGPLRAEVVPVASHDEANYVGRHVLLARGWNRQLDDYYNPVLYDAGMTAAEYFVWLQDNGVSVVAIADTDLDKGGLREQALLVDPPAYLNEIFHDRRWRVYEVEPQPTLAADGALVTDVGLSSFTIEASATGPVAVKVRFSPWMAVTSGEACVREGADGWAAVDVRTPGRVTVEASLSVSRIFDRDGDC